MSSFVKVLIHLQQLKQSILEIAGLGRRLRSVEKIARTLRKILEQIKKNQDVWEQLLQEPQSSFKDKALDHIKGQSQADDLAFSFLTDALNTVKEKMEFSSYERDKIFAPSN
ncbi:hypothetical protein HanXRQr2_Chr05g0232551 [Helianthus annuus]|uniref:Uncharacterized protein n=1 Tax=Helianthus annuus TaxID=4232 RepID=A0A251URP2_HELAN|nr:hypothetical protein HanXRQr2_Chr05g0232551 [Helianthus annuus]KAJ0924094.1 hypothetical protein HanPSC8_Chr05g0224271 [Helianthus annuus]